MKGEFGPVLLFLRGYISQASGGVNTCNAGFKGSFFFFHNSAAGIITLFEIHISSSKLVIIQVN